MSRIQQIMGNGIPCLHRTWRRHTAFWTNLIIHQFKCYLRIKALVALQILCSTQHAARPTGKSCSSPSVRTFSRQHHPPFNRLSVSFAIFWMSDDTILRKSDLFECVVTGILDGFRVVGSSSYPLLDWLLVPLLGLSMLSMRR